MLAKTEEQKIIHLLYRAGFGPSIQSILDFTSLSFEQAVEKIFQDSIPFIPLKWKGAVRKNETDEMELSAGKGVKTIRILSRDAKQEINLRWVHQMIHSDAQLREKMAFFWHDHFAASMGSPYPTLQYANTIRKHALGYFGEMLFAIARDNLMISFLNNKQNVKGRPNENFAREVMELFTLGTGHYTEFDIQEAARAFTGWTINKEGGFRFNKKNHDNGLKQFMGKEGYFTGDDILNILLDHPQTSYFLCKKIYSFLVGKEPNEQTLKNLSKNFHSNAYDISWLIKSILLSEDFTKPEHFGIRIKSPIELIIGQCRLLAIKFGNPKILTLLQYKLKQRLLYPPSVSGWPKGKYLVDLESIGDRIQLAETILEHKRIRIKKHLVSLEGDQASMDKQKNINNEYMEVLFEKILSKENGLDFIRLLAYTCPTDHLNKFFSSLTNGYAERTIETKKLLINLLSQPEYQLN